MESGKLVNKVGFEIDSQSWKNLDRFQKRLTDMKKQMKGLSTSLNVRATVSQFKQVADGVERVQRQTQRKMSGLGMEFGKPKGTDRTYASWWEDQLKAKDKATRDAERRAKSARPFQTPTEQALGVKFNTGRDKTYAAWWEDQLKAKEKVSSDFYRRKRQMASKDANIMAAETRFEGLHKRTPLREGNKAEWEEAFAGLAHRYRTTSMSSKVFNAELNNINRNLAQQERAARGSSMSLNQMRREMINLTAAYSAGSALVNVFNTGKTLQSMEAGMKIFAKDEKGIAENMKFIADEADRLGINFMEAAQNYTKFAIVSRNKLTTQDTRALFSGFSEYATVLQVDQHRFSRGMMALQQMMSKGKISSEELRLQLT